MAEIKSYPNNADVEIGAENVMKWHHGRTSGVYGAEGELVVAPTSPASMTVTITDGHGWLTDAIGNGIHWWLDAFALTAALLQLTHDTADGVLNRIDRIIVEWSTPNYTQLPEIKILKGTNAVTAVAPALTNNASLRQISLARVSIPAGTLAITAGMITDEKTNPAVCGIVTETTVVDTTMAAAQYEALFAAMRQAALDFLGEVLPDHASTHAAAGDDPIPPESINASKASTIHDFTLDADNWDAEEYTITSSDVAGLSAVTANTAVEILPGLSITVEELDALQAANIQDGGQSAGSITLKAFGGAPTIDIPIRILIRGDLY